MVKGEVTDECVTNNPYLDLNFYFFICVGSPTWHRAIGPHIVKQTPKTKIYFNVLKNINIVIDARSKIKFLLFDPIKIGKFLMFKGFKE